MESDVGTLGVGFLRTAWSHSFLKARWGGLIGLEEVVRGMGVG